MKNRTPHSAPEPRTITIRLRYRGESPRLERLDGVELPDVPGTQAGIEKALRSAVGPVVLILDSEEDGDVVVMTLGDPPKAEAAPVEEGSTQAQGDEAEAPKGKPKTEKPSKNLPRRFAE